MKFTKIAILGAMLAASAPLALADRLYGEIDTQGGKAIVTSTGVTFGNTVSAAPTNKTLSGAPKGSVIDGDSSDDFAYFDGQAHSASQTAGNGFQYFTGSATTPYTITFATLNAAGANNGAGTRVFTLIEDGATLRFYITSVDLSTVAVTSGKTSTAATGTFSGTGYITVSGNSNPALNTTKTVVTYTLTNTTGQRGTNFTFSILAPTPEPSSLALLGTGMMGAAGMIFRKRRAA